MLQFTHTGSVGDALYSLTFIREYLESVHESQCRLTLIPNTPANHVEGHPYGEVLLSRAAVDFLQPLLDYQPYLNSDAEVTGTFDLSAFRKLPLFLSAGDLRYFYYPLTPVVLPKDFQRPCLEAPVNEQFRDKIVLFRSGRYHNPLVSYSALSSLKSDIVFIGLPEEHYDFCSSQFPVEFYKVRDALEVASIMKAAKCVIGNQTGLFAIAEQLKVHRILESCQVWQVNNRQVWGLPNVLPMGGRCTMAIAPITPEIIAAL